MKKRLVKKQITKVIGYNVNGEAVYNCVSNPEYNGGSTVNEDYYNFEIKRTRKKYGSPLVLRKRYAQIYNRVNHL